MKYRASLTTPMIPNSRLASGVRPPIGSSFLKNSRANASKARRRRRTATRAWKVMRRSGRRPIRARKGTRAAKSGVYRRMLWLYRLRRQPRRAAGSRSDGRSSGTPDGSEQSGILEGELWGLGRVFGVDRNPELPICPVRNWSLSRIRQRVQAAFPLPALSVPSSLV